MLQKFKGYQVDLFAVPISLNHEGRHKANSRHGIFMTLLFVGFIAWSVYSLSHELFVKKNPNTINYDSFVETPAPMELNKDSFPFAFGLQLPIMQGLTFFKDEQIYKPDVKLVVFNIIKGSDGTVTKERELIDIDVETCRLEHFGESWSSFTNLPLEMLYCIKPNQSNLDKIIVKGIEDFTNYQALNLAIVKCDDTVDPTCKSGGEVEEKLTGAWLNIFYTQSAINPQNFTQPNQRFRTTFASMITPSVYKSAITKLNHLNVISDDGWLFETEKTQNYIKMNAPTEYLDLTPSDYGFLWNGVFEISQIVTTYERKYTKLQTVLAQIQGSAATVILILVIVLQPYSQVKFNETLINELFDVKIKKRDGKSGKGSKKNESKIQKQKTTGQVKRVPREHKIEVKLPNITAKEDMEERMRSERALISPRIQYEEERYSDPILSANKIGTIQSFKTLLCSIENENDSPGVPYYQKPTQTLVEQAKSQETKSGTMRRSNKGLSLTVDKPERVKLPAVLSDVVSDGPDSPRKISEFSSQEENENSSEEEDRKRGEGKIYHKHPEEILTSPVSPQSGLLSQDHEKQPDGVVSVEMIDLEEGNNNADGVKELPTISLKIEGDERETNDEDSTNYESSKIDISIWEFFLSYIKKTKRTKEKFEVLNKGMKNVRERMDILNIMKKFREFDKLKALLLEEDQLVLFNAIPKAEMKASRGTASTMTSEGDLTKSKTVSGRILKKSTFIDINEKQEQVKKSYDNIQLKMKKSKIDSRLLEIYNELLFNK